MIIIRLWWRVKWINEYTIIIRLWWWGTELWERLACAPFIQRSDCPIVIVIVIAIVKCISLSCWTVSKCNTNMCHKIQSKGILENICCPQKTFPTSYNPTVFDTYPTDMVLADEEKTVSGKNHIHLKYIFSKISKIWLQLHVCIQHFTISVGCKSEHLGHCRPRGIWKLANVRFFTFFNIVHHCSALGKVAKYTTTIFWSDITNH